MYGLKHQKEKRSMHFAGLDVSVKNTSVCIVDEMGKIAMPSRAQERKAEHPSQLK